MPLSASDIEKIFSEGPSLLDHLPYADEQDGVFVNVDGSLGRVLEVKPFGAEAMSVEMREAFSSQVAGIVSRLSPRLSLQVILWSDTDIRKCLEEYQATGEKEDSDIVRASTEARVEHLGKTVKPRQMRVFVTVRYFPKFNVPAWPGRARSYLNKSINGGMTGQEKEREAFLKLIVPIENALGSLGMPFSVLNADGLEIGRAHV